jgi:hypothetical protein
MACGVDMKIEAWLIIKTLKDGTVNRFIIDGAMDPREVHDNGGEYIPLGRIEETTNENTKSDS